jgi:hypothetical protein
MALAVLFQAATLATKTSSGFLLILKKSLSISPSNMSHCPVPYSLKVGSIEAIDTITVNTVLPFIKTLTIQLQAATFGAVACGTIRFYDFLVLRKQGKIYERLKTLKTELKEAIIQGCT